MNGYARLTETYLQRSGLRVVTVWDNATPMQRASYERHCRNLYGATVQNFRDVPSVAGSVEAERLRFEKLVIPYAGSYEHIGGSLKGELERWDGADPLFAAYQVSIWGEMKPDRIVDLAREMEEHFPAKVAFVRADHYFALYNEAHGLPFNLVTSAETSVTADAGGSDPRLAADGTPTTVWTHSGNGAAELRFDFGGTYRITRCVVRHAGAGGENRALNTRAFTVRAGLDESPGNAVAVCRNNMDDVTDVDLPPTEARYVTLTVDSPGEDGIARIADVGLFGARLLRAHGDRED
jgi:hypothetical protein